MSIRGGKGTSKEYVSGPWFMKPDIEKLSHRKYMSMAKGTLLKGVFTGLP